MKTKRTILSAVAALLFLFPLTIVTVSCSSCGQGAPVSVARPYEKVVDLLTPEERDVIKLKQNERKKETLLVFWRQAIWWKGLRYRIAIRSLDQSTTELRGWVCDDSSMVPGCNVFTKRPLLEKSFHDLIKRAEDWREYHKKWKAQDASTPTNQPALRTD
jgi:hypothetical protein